MENLCETCILNGRCDGRCGDTDALYYAFEEENDYYNSRDYLQSIKNKDEF